MTLQASGTISLAQVNAELGRASNAQISLNVYSAGGTAVVQTGGTTVNINQCSPSRPNTSAPTSMNEWYSYDHNAICGGTPTYPCNINSGIVAIGSGGNSGILYDKAGKPFDTYTEIYNAIVSSSGYVFNFYGIYNSDGSPAPSTNTIWPIGMIVRNQFATYDTDPRFMGKRCGYVFQQDGYNYYIYALDAVGQIIERILITI